MYNLRHVLLFLLLCLTGAAQSKAINASLRSGGAGDELGAANYVTPAQVSAAASLVKAGQSHGLGIVIESGMPAFPPRDTQLQIVQPGQELVVTRHRLTVGRHMSVTTTRRCG